MRLTSTQLEVLRLVVARGPLRTTTSTHGDNVNGTTAASLVRRGLLRYVGDKVEATGAGRDTAAR